MPVTRAASAAVLWRRGGAAGVLLVLVVVALLGVAVQAAPRPHAYGSNTSSATDTLSLVSTDSDTLTDSASESATATSSPSESNTWSTSDDPTATATSSESPSDPTPTRGSTSMTATDAESFTTSMSRIPSDTKSPTPDETASESQSLSPRTHTPSRSMESATETADDSNTDTTSYSYIPPTPTPPDTHTDSATASRGTPSASATRQSTRSSSSSPSLSRWAHSRTSRAVSPTATGPSRTSSASKRPGATPTALSTLTHGPTPSRARTATPTPSPHAASATADGSESLGSFSDTRLRSQTTSRSHNSTTSRSVLPTRTRTYYVPPLTPVPPTPGPTDAPPIWAIAASVRLSGQSWGLVLADTVANARLARAVVLDVTAMIAAARLSGRLHPSAAEGVRVTSLTEGSLIANVTIAVEGSLDDVVAVRDALVVGFSTVPLTAVLPSTWLFYQSEMSAVGIPDVAPLTLAQPGRFVVIAPVGSANATTAAPAATLAPAESDDEEGGGFSCDLWFCGAFIIFVVVCLLCVCAVVVYLCTRPAGGRADERKSQTTDTVAPGPSDRPEPRRSDEGAAKDSAPLPPPPPPPPARPPGADRGKSFDSSPNPIAIREADAESLDIMTPTPWEFEPAYDEAGKDPALRTPSFLRAEYPPEKHPRGPSWQRRNPQEEYAVAPPAIYDARRGAASESALVPPSRAASEARFLPVSPSPERPRDAVHRQFSYMSTVSQLSDTATPQPQRQASTSVASAGGRQRGLVLSPPPPPRAHHHHQGPRPPMSDTTEIVDVLAMTPTDPFSLGEPGVEVPLTPVTGPARQDLGRRPGSSAASIIVMDESE